MGRAGLRDDDTIEPRTLTLEEAAAGRRPRAFTPADWDALNLGVAQQRRIERERRRAQDGALARRVGATR